MPKTFDDVLGDFEKKYDGLKIGLPKPVVGLTTGNLAIDWQTGVGGIPAGRITELYGYEASGKTTTALQTAVALQQRILADDTGQRILYLDFEHALDVGYATSLGIEFGHPSFVPLQPSNLEQGANAALDLIETGKVPLVVFDSVAAMSPRRLKEGEFDQATIQMLRAKLMSALCASSVDLLYRTDCAAIFVNHKMESIDMSGRPGLPPKVTTPGGRGLKYYASLRLEFDTIAGVKQKQEDLLTGTEVNQLVGSRVFVKCVKNKVGTPGRVVELRNRYGLGFDNTWSALQILLSHGEIKKNGAWFTFTVPELTAVASTVFPGRDPATKIQLHGEPAILECADDNPDFSRALIDAAKRCLSNVP